jgi:hypothetical protein
LILTASANPWNVRDDRASVVQGSEAGKIAILVRAQARKTRCMLRNDSGQQRLESDYHRTANPENPFVFCRQLEAGKRVKDAEALCEVLAKVVDLARHPVAACCIGSESRWHDCEPSS